MKLFAAIVLAGACRMAPAPPAVPVQGGDAEISAFSGEWVGRYSSKATGRRGTIRFNLPEHADTGYGEVEITFSPSLHLNRETQSADPKADPEELSPQPCTAIGITVIRFEHDPSGERWCRIGIPAASAALIRCSRASSNATASRAPSVPAANPGIGRSSRVSGALRGANDDVIRESST